MLLIKMSITLSQKMQNKVVRSDSDAPTCELLAHHLSTHLCCHCRGGRVTDLSLLVLFYFLLLLFFSLFFWLQNKANTKPSNIIVWHCIRFHVWGLKCLKPPKSRKAVNIHSNRHRVDFPTQKLLVFGVESRDSRKYKMKVGKSSVFL